VPAQTTGVKPRSDPRPDFTGRWSAVSPGYEGREVRIAQAKGTLRITNGLERTPESVTYNLDGSPRREPGRPGEERWATLAWKQDTLVLLDTRMTRTSEVRTEHTLSFDTSRRLILGITRTELAAAGDGTVAAPSPQRKTVIVLQKSAPPRSRRSR
jgi:hypothetical protein